jgi:GT2 family glycosyltransferase
MTGFPRVSLIILNYNGRAYLDRGIQSALALDYPPEALEVILCDNGSSDGSVDYVKTRYTGVRVVALDTNYGFAEGNNRAAELSNFEWLAFVNNDMWFKPNWLRNLVGALQDHPGAQCVTCRIMNWDGTAIDFIGSGANFEGHGFQVDHGRPRSDLDTERRVIAPCGGAMLIERALFLAVGGFDQSYFSFFEDTDLGWRLNLLGHDVWYTPRATTYHLQHATARRFPRHRLRVLYERNALFTIYKCLDDANLAAALPAAMLLMNERGLRIAGVKLSEFRVAERRRSPRIPTEGETPIDSIEAGGSLRDQALGMLRARGPGQFAVRSARYTARLAASAVRKPLLKGGMFMPSVAMSHYVAMHDFAASLKSLQDKRKWLQERRVRTDAELEPLFFDALRPTWDDPAYVRFYTWLVRTLGLDQRFGAVGDRRPTHEGRE